MNRNGKPLRGNRKLITVCLAIIMIIAMGITVNAASGGAVSQYFDDLLGVGQKMQITSGGDEPVTIYMDNLDIGVYDGEQNLVQDLSNKHARDIHFDQQNQTCEINGTRYHVFLLVDVDKGAIRNHAHGQLRLYVDEDFAKAQETLVVPKGMYCPAININ